MQSNWFQYWGHATQWRIFQIRPPLADSTGATGGRNRPVPVFSACLGGYQSRGRGSMQAGRREPLRSHWNRLRKICLL